MCRENCLGAILSQLSIVPPAEGYRVALFPGRASDLT